VSYILFTPTTLTSRVPKGVLLKCSQDVRFRVIPPSKSTSNEINAPHAPPPPLSESAELNSSAYLPVSTIEVFGSLETGKQPRQPRNMLTRRRTPRTFYESFRSLCANYSQGNDAEPHAKPLTLHLISRNAAKSAIASIARSVAYQSHKPIQHPDSSKQEDVFSMSVRVLDSLLDGAVHIKQTSMPSTHFSTGHNGLSSPDLLIVYPITTSRNNRSPLELHGFPPWQIRVTEIQ
jgi:dehydrodolichyl diphosphate syntase complex subunit NUS1